MNLSGHVLWKRKVIGACERAIIGNPSAVAPAAAPVARKRRRVGFLEMLLSAVPSRFVVVPFPLVAPHCVHALAVRPASWCHAFDLPTFRPVANPALFAKMFGLR